MKSPSQLATLFLVLIESTGCGPGLAGPGSAPAEDPSGWTYVSEWLPVDLLAVGDGKIWAVDSTGLMRTDVQGGAWVSIKGLVPEGDPHPFRALMVDSSGSLWAGGDAMVAEVGKGTASRYTTIEESLGTVSGLAETDGGVHVAGGCKVATRRDGEWAIQDLPFSIEAAASTRDALWVAAGPQGLARIQGEEVTEYPDPLDAKSSGGRRVTSLVARGEQVWALWTAGDGGYVARLEEGSWQAWAVPDPAGDLVRLLGSGRDVYLQTSSGLFDLRPSPAEGALAMEPLFEPALALGFSYMSPSAAPGEQEGEAQGAAGPLTPGTLPEAVPSLDVPPGHKYAGDPMSLVPVPTAFLSTVTALAGDGRLAAVGTRSTGVYVLEEGAIEAVIAPYEVKPRTPFSSFGTGEEFYYVLASSGQAGVVRGATFGAQRITSDEHETLLALDQRDGQGYALSLVKELETLQFFEYRDGAFVKVMDRAVEIASGIKDVGGMAGKPDGSFWFTVISATEGLEMGVGAVHPALEYIVYHGSVPVPAEQAVTIPNGVRHVQVDAEGNIWLGGMEGAIMLDADLEPSLYKEQQGLVGDMVVDLVIDGDGRVWALTVDGLGWFESGAWKFPDLAPYRGNVIDCLGLDAQGRLLMADEQAVRRLDGDGFELVVARKDLPGMEVLDVEAGAGGRIWVITDRAIAIAPGK